MTSAPLIAIIGAGPAGLALARLLELANIAYVVFERDESRAWAHEHQSSGTLDIHQDSGQLVLREASLLDEFQSMARQLVPTKIVDAKAQVHAQFPGKGNNRKPEIDRKDLRDLLVSSVPPSKVRWASKIRHVQNRADGSVSVHFADGRVESGFRLVVGADGAWSKVRNLITTVKPRCIGTHFLTTYIKPGNPIYTSAASMAEKGNYLALSQGQQIFLHYMGDESYHLAVGLKLPEGGALEDAKSKSSPQLWQSVLQGKFDGWAAELTQLIESSDGDFRLWPLHTMPVESLPWEHVSGVTLIGDAAHVTVPSGDGVNNAMLDSLELARQIIQHGINDLDAAAIAYEKTMLPRAVEAMAKGQWYADRFFNADTPQTFLRAVGAGDENQ